MLSLICLILSLVATALTVAWTFVAHRKAAYCSQYASELAAAMKEVKRLNVWASDVQATMNELMDSHARLRSRTGMRELRDKKGETHALDALTGQAWKDAKRKQLGLGQITPTNKFTLVSDDAVNDGKS